MADLNKLGYAQALQGQITNIARLKGPFADLVSGYFNRGYNSGGSQPIADADVASLSIKAADVTNAITFLQQFALFLGNSGVTTGNYQASLDAVRNDT